jgi:hypothetical protein
VLEGFSIITILTIRNLDPNFRVRVLDAEARLVGGLSIDPARSASTTCRRWALGGGVHVFLSVGGENKRDVPQRPREKQMCLSAVASLDWPSPHHPPLDRFNNSHLFVRETKVVSCKPGTPKTFTRISNVLTTLVYIHIISPQDQSQ